MASTIITPACTEFNIASIRSFDSFNSLALRLLLLGALDEALQRFLHLAEGRLILAAIGAFHLFHFRLEGVHDFIDRSPRLYGQLLLLIKPLRITAVKLLQHHTAVLDGALKDKRL